MNKPKKWTYNYADLAKLLELKEANVRRKVCDGEFDPSSLESVVYYMLGKKALLLCEQIAQSKGKWNS